MSAVRFQYVTVQLPTAYPPQTEEQVWTERLNAVAAEGWRLVTISEKPGKGIAYYFATFERDLPS